SPTDSEPVAIEPATIEPIADGDAPITTNEASSPAVSDGSASIAPGSPEPALGPIERRPGPEADRPASSHPLDAGPEDGAPIATNEAISPTANEADGGAPIATNEATAAVDARTNPSGADRPPEMDDRTHRRPEQGRSWSTTTIDKI